MKSELKFTSFNVKGLANDSKRRQMFYYFHEKKLDIIFIQETHSTKAKERWWNTTWGSKILYSHGTSNARGVAILISKNTPIEVHNVISSENGQYLLLYCTLNHRKVLLVNVYAPNIDTPDFFRNLFTDIERFTPDYIIMGGDMNLAMDPILDRQGSHYNNDNSVKVLKHKLEQLDLIDYYRFANPDQSGFTYMSYSHKLAFSRIDYFFVSEPIVQFIKRIKVLPAFNSDHSLILLEIELENFKRGSGYWRLNTKYLRDPDYVNKMNLLLDTQLEVNANLKASHKWEMLKLSVSGSSQQYAKRVSKSDKMKTKLLEKKLERLQAEAQGVNPLNFTDTKMQISKVRHELNELSKKKTRSAALQCRAQWESQADKPTKYFLNLEKHNYLKKMIYRLKTDCNTTLTEETEILEEIKRYFKDLYTSKIKPDPSYLDSLDIPQITPELREECDRLPTKGELTLALKLMPNNKVGGTDGIPADFYKVFWAKLRDPLYEAYLEAIQEEKLHITARRSVISLLEKPSGTPLTLKSWRPLSLLNVDNKLFAKILALRMQKALPSIHDFSQTGFIKGRYLAESIMKILEVVNKCKQEKLNALLVSFDFRKAFDTVEFSALKKALEVFGFGPKYIKLVNILFTDQLATVMNNGKWSSWFTPTRGARQGCCYSLGGFTLLVELLGIGLRSNPDIKGIHLGELEIKAVQFVDDLWSTIKTDSLNATLIEIHKFSKFSGLQLNYDKCAVLKLGPCQFTDAKYYSMKKLHWFPKSIKILGISISMNRQIMYEENFLKPLKKCKSILASWKNR